MPPTQALYLLDFLAPRVFRPASPKRALRSVGREVRSSSSAAAVSRSEDARIDDEVGEGRRRDAWTREENALAGPSRWQEQLERESRARYAARTREPLPGEEAELGNERDVRLDGEAGSPRSVIPDMTPLPLIPHSTFTPSPSKLPQYPLYNPQPKSKPLPRRSRPHPHARQPQPFSAHFTLPNPPAASALLPLLQPTLTKSSGELLIRYAQRVDDIRTEVSTRDMMGRMRIAPVSWISDISPSRRRFPAIQGRVGGDGDEEKQDFRPGDDPPDPGGTWISEPEPQVILRRPPTTEMKELRTRSNIWARKMWPPLSPFSASLPTESEAHTFLCRQHHHLIYPPRARRPFIDALRRLEVLPGVKERDLLGLLHLYLAYPIPPVYPTRPSDRLRDIPPHLSPPPPPDNPETPATTLLTPLHQFLLHCPNLRPTRQTLHLLILSTLSASFPSNPALIPPGGRRAQIDALLTLFRTQWGITPGCESWRHITRFAVSRHKRLWAREGWEGWWNARERGDEGQWNDFWDMGGAEGDFGEVQPGEGDENASAAESGEDSDDVIFRFRHRGREFIRWMRVVKTMEEEGWVKQREVMVVGSEKQEGKDGWDWIHQ